MIFQASEKGSRYSQFTLLRERIEVRCVGQVKLTSSREAEKHTTVLFFPVKCLEIFQKSESSLHQVRDVNDVSRWSQHHVNSNP